MNYLETIDYLFSRLPMFSRIGPDAFKKDLTNTRKLCGLLGDPHKKFKSVHVGGTNGKGSVSHMLASIFQEAGYKTGLYTSPHLKDFRERIRIDGEMVNKDYVVDFTEKLKPCIEEINPSFFEITVAMAFDYFARNEVDIAIVEVGLGGRLDSTNIITPELAIITNISYDHMNMLGYELEKIAFEKAGIIKPGVPVVIGEAIPETEKVFRMIAMEKNSPISIASEKRRVTEWNLVKNELVVDTALENKQDRHQYHLDVTGLYQAKNLLIVLESCSQLQQLGWRIDETHIKKGLRQVVKSTGLHGRWQVVHQHPKVILDVAHNEDGIQQLVKQIEIIDHTLLHLVIGFVKDKEIEKILALLPDRARYYFTHAHIPRALDASTLQQKASSYGLRGKIYEDVNTALHYALTEAGKDDLVIVCGSVFLVGEVNLN